MKTCPLISCLCVTKNKLDILIRALDCFQAQSYPNKELIIVKQGDDKSVAEYIRNLNDARITYKQLTDSPKLLLGDLRNISISISKGDYFCVWDDDDWNHKDRLSIQATAMLENYHRVSALTNLIVFDKVNERAYFSPCRIWEGTILCAKELFLKGLKYPSKSKGEDTTYVNHLLMASKIYPVVTGTAYIYVFHGDNTWPIDHFKQHLFQQPLSTKASKYIKDLLVNHKNVEASSLLLDQSVVPQELNYFYSNRKTSTP